MTMANGFACTKHKWNYIQGQINGAWVASYQCISQVNTVLRDFNTVDFSAIGVY